MAELKAVLIGDSRPLVKSLDAVDDALVDVVEELVKVQKEGDETERELDRNMNKIADDAKRRGKEAGKGLSKGLSDGTADAKREAASSGKEAAASFSGGFDDVSDFLQETLANAFEGFGPAAGAAGAALAVVLGTVLAAATAAQEKLADAREAAGDLSQTLFENNGRLPLEDAISNVLALLPGERKAGNPFEAFIDQWADLGSVIDAVRSTARRTTTPVETLVRALSGGDLDATADSIAAIRDALADIGDEANRGSTPLGDLAAQEAELQGLLTQLEGVQTAGRLARESLGLVGSSFVSQAYIDQVNDLAGAWDAASTAAEDYFIEAEDGATSFDWASYLHDAETTITESARFKARLIGLPADIAAEAIRVYTAQGPKNANSYVSAYVAASSAMKQRLINAAAANGKAAGDAGGKALADSANAAARARAQALGPIPIGVSLDTSGIARQLAQYRVPTLVIPGRIEPRDSSGRVWEFQ